MSAASLSIGSPVISISFSGMNEAKRKIVRAREEARCEAESLLSAIASLQVSDGRLRMKAEALNSLRGRIDKRQSGLQAIGAHIDYAVRRSREVDELCAQRISSKGCESARLQGLSTKGGIYGSIAAGLNSVVDQGKAAWDYVKANGNMILDCVQTGLDIVGLIPGFGEAADGINAGIYLLRGDYGSAALSLAAMIPVLGCAATAGKLINKGVKAYKQSKNIANAIDTAGDVYGIVKKTGNKGIQKAAGIASDLIEDARRAFGKSPSLAAEGAGTLRGNLSYSGKAGIAKAEETPAQKSFNAAYRDSAAGVNKAEDAAGGTSKFIEGAGKSLSGYGAKSESYLTKRGWTWNSAQDVVGNPYTTREAVNKATGNSATVFYNKSGDYVVRDNVTGELVQTSKFGDVNWIPDSSIINPYKP